jgi:hypothetical protein
VENGHVHVLQALLKAADSAGVKRELLLWTNESDSWNCLHNDVENGHVHMLQALLKAADSACVKHGLLML